MLSIYRYITCKWIRVSGWQCNGGMCEFIGCQFFIFCPIQQARFYALVWFAAENAPCARCCSAHLPFIARNHEVQKWKVIIMSASSGVLVKETHTHTQWWIRKPTDYYDGNDEQKKKHTKQTIKSHGRPWTYFHHHATVATAATAVIRFYFLLSQKYTRERLYIIYA